MKIDWHRIITPSAWLQLGSVDWEYDAIVNDLLDQFGIEPFSYHSAKSGNLLIWIDNYPYAYGSPGHETGGDYTLPSMRTRKRIKKMIALTNKKKWLDQCN